MSQGCYDDATRKTASVEFKLSSKTCGYLIGVVETATSIQGQLHDNDDDDDDDRCRHLQITAEYIADCIDLCCRRYFAFSLHRPT